MALGIIVKKIVILLINRHSYKALINQSKHPTNVAISRSSCNNAKEVRRKRNLEAVRTLQKISMTYAICYLPASLYYLLLVAMILNYKGNETLLSQIYDTFAVFHTPLFLCSGINALIYMAKDRRIVNYYKRKCLCFFNHDRTEGRRENNRMASLRDGRPSARAFSGVLP